jgi:hypothetical protein
MYQLSTIPENQAKALATAAQEERNSEFGKLLKFNKGKYFCGDDEVALGREYIAHTSQWTRGWVKFVDNVPVEKRIGKAIDGFKVPERDELGDLDHSQWEKEDGTPKDPWSRQTYLPLVDTDSGEIIVFVSGSQGGRGAVGTLCDMAAQNYHRGQPHIKLAVRSYKHKKYGRIETPEFPVVGWTGGSSPTDSLAEIMCDEVPFSNQ